MHFQQTEHLGLNDDDIEEMFDQLIEDLEKQQQHTSDKRDLKDFAAQCCEKRELCKRNVAKLGCPA